METQRSKQIANAALLYDAVLHALKGNFDNPLPAPTLFGNPSIAKLAPSADKVSNVLHYLHKTGRVSRVPLAVPGHKAIRFGYLDADAKVPKEQRAAAATRKYARRSPALLPEVTLNLLCGKTERKFTWEEARALYAQLKKVFK